MKAVFKHIIFYKGAAMKKSIIGMFLLVVFDGSNLCGQFIKIGPKKKEQYAFSQWSSFSDSNIHLKDAIKTTMYNRFVEEAQAQDKTVLHYIIDKMVTIKGESDAAVALDMIEYAIGKDSKQLTQEIAHKNPVLYAYGKYKGEPFIVALVDVMLRLGANPNCCDETGWSLLHYAVEEQCDEIVKLLIVDHSANVNCATLNSKITPLHLACALGDIECFELLMAKGAKANITSSCGASAAHYVAGRELSVGYSGCFLKLVPFAKKDYKGDKEDEALYAKQISIRERMLVRLIIEGHVSCFKSKDNLDFCAYDYAAKYEHDDLWKIMSHLEKSISDNKQIRMSPKKEDDTNGNPDQKEVASNETFDAWIATAQSLKYPILQYVLDSVESVESLSELDFICDGIEYVLSKNPQLIEESIDDKEPIFYMVEKYLYTPWVRLLAEIMLKYNANADACDDDGWSLLHCAIKARNAEFLKVILSYHPDIAVWTTKEKITPIQLACFYGDKEIFDILLKYSPDLTHKDSNGSTVMHFIVGRGYYKDDWAYASVLPPFNQVNKENVEFYKEQIKSRKYMLFRLINEKNVSIYTTDKAGLSAYDYAKKYGHKDLVAVMEKDEPDLWVE